MDRVFVQSSHLYSVGYDSVSSVMEVEFVGGGIYQYFGIPEHIHEGLMNASSKGSYFDQNIKKAGYSYSKVG